MKTAIQKLHVGCGPHYIPGMFNIDIRQDVKTDYCGSYADLKGRIENNSVSLIWSCHMLEHLPYPGEVTNCLETFYDWLAPEGILRLALPDLRLVAGYYVHNDPTLFSMYNGAVDSELYKPESKAEMFTFFMRGWEHTVVFDFELIRGLLMDAGFKTVLQMPFGQSQTGSWAYDRMPKESMYLEGIK